MSDIITANSSEDQIDRRGFLRCMAWAGTGLVFGVSGGILSSRMLVPDAAAADIQSGPAFRFVQISDSHIGFHKRPTRM